MNRTTMTWAINTLGILCFVFCAWISLWVISRFLLPSDTLAVVFFPFALRLGLILNSRRIYWGATYLAEWLALITLYRYLPAQSTFHLWLLSVLSWPICHQLIAYTTSRHWSFLSLASVATIIHSVAIVAVGYCLTNDKTLLLLVPLTAMLIALPCCYLIKFYLFSKPWGVISARIADTPIHFHWRNGLICTTAFILNLLIQTQLPPALNRFAPFFLAIPIILFALKYGWQGSFLATLFNSLALIAAHIGSDAAAQTIELLLSLSVQTVTGIGLGLAVQRQQNLTQDLQKQLNKNQYLSRQLISTEEKIRRHIARELHDEVGQNITAIKTHASIIKRLDGAKAYMPYLQVIDDMSMNIYQSTKTLLSQLRPTVLDDVGFDDAIAQLIHEMGFSAKDVEVDLTITHHHPVSDTVRVTVYRICQEALNNIHKHANANRVEVTITLDRISQLQVTDDGCGFSPREAVNGFGLKGIRERVVAMGGACNIQSTPSGTRLAVSLPHIP
ncbi:signal transduction histidine-protein kinase/phosphatase UhpB [Salinivibrio kushneri]|uniref:signal transduction histidine-protein kinase/phosphatase UhpB n=1 Tax=Salinivibrio kushneri TaxID=1908198 RepID=UPI001300F763|nr:signal transduction histidine-protein kinase/phosphatase UhpB [Salinivibrio kushneri]